MVELIFLSKIIRHLNNRKNWNFNALNKSKERRIESFEMDWKGKSKHREQGIRRRN